MLVRTEVIRGRNQTEDRWTRIEKSRGGVIRTYKYMAAIGSDGLWRVYRWMPQQGRWVGVATKLTNDGYRNWLNNIVGLDDEED